MDLLEFAKGSGSRVYFNGTRLAISAKTEYPDEAWEFVRYCLLSDYDGTGFPVVRARFEKALEKSLEEEVTEAYFQGQKSAEGSAAIIQNRIQLYLDERD